MRFEDVRLADMGEGITRVDTNYIRGDATACYIVRDGKHAGVIDTGAVDGPDAVLAGLAELGLEAADVDYVMPTHVHLDHAGAAGTLMRLFERAELLAHPRGARHLIDPTRLAAGARAVYGDEKFVEYYGEIVPVAAARVREVAHGEVVALGKRKLQFHHALGHASHHYCVYDQQSGGLFTGDTFGVSFREFDQSGRSFVFPASAPVDFDPDAWLKTLDDLERLRPTRVYLTHFGAIDDVADAAEQLRAGLRKFREIAEDEAQAKELHQAIKLALTDYLLSALRDYDSPLSEAEALGIMEVDLEVNTQGLVVWLERRASTPAG